MHLICLRSTLTFLSLMVLLTLVSPQASAQLAMQGITDGAQTGILNQGAIGAITNQGTATKLFQLAQQHETQAWAKGFPPNLALLAQASSESLQGIQANDQAKELGRAAVNTLNTGMHSGAVDMQKAGGLNAEQLNSLATQDNALLPTVKSKMSAYGVKVSSDGQNFVTPIGTYPISTTVATLEWGFKIGAKMFGLSGDAVAAGIQAGVRNKDAAAQAALAEAQNQLARLAAESANKSSPETPTAEELSAEQILAKGEGETEKDNTRMLATAAEALGADSSLSEEERLKRFQAFEMETKRRLGMQSASAPEALGRKDQDLFHMVHTRYERMRTEGSFIETFTLSAIDDSLKSAD